jgi:hypothetical protein
MTESNRSKFMKMRRNDEIMLTVRDSGKFGFIGEEDTDGTVAAWQAARNNGSDQKSPNNLARSLN